MHKIYTVLIAAFFINTSISYANNRIDSIGVENNKGKKVILYKVEAKETYYSISKKYNVSYKDVMTFNDSKLLQIGVIIKVPTEMTFTSTNQPVITSTGFTEYTIKPKDNLNMLAENYGTTVNEIKRLNNLSSINLQIGQVLKIPTSNEKPLVQETPAVVKETPVAVPIKKPTETPETINTNGNIVEHTVAPKENLNLIAKKYGTTVDEIKRLNGLRYNNLRIGQVLKVSSTTEKNTETVAETPVNTNPVKTQQKPVIQEPIKTNNNTPNFEHTVITGETIYSIAKKYNLTTYQLKSFNNLTSNEVTVGQKLLIKGVMPQTTPTEEDDENRNEANADSIKDPKLKYPPSKYGLSQIEEKGTGVWITDADLDPSKMLILHRTAPVGTIVKITNPMTNRSTFAKVVGKFTENETTKDVIIVMTKAVADAIGALDKRFFCNLTYGAQENEQ
jgi:LysM repeat protein